MYVYYKVNLFRLTEVLFEQIDRDNRDELKRKQQQDDIYKPDEDDYDDDGSNNESMTVEVNNSSSFWGEYSKPKNHTVKIGKRRWKEDHFLNSEQCNAKDLSENERLLLLNEFKSHMIHKFLSGQEDFDYKYEILKLKMGGTFTFISDTLYVN